jgi:hypothetical protein
MTLPCFVCRGPIETGETVAWFDGVEWTAGGPASENLLPHGHYRPAHAYCSDDPQAIAPDIRAALEAGFLPSEEQRQWERDIRITAEPESGIARDQVEQLPLGLNGR